MHLPQEPVPLEAEARRCEWICCALDELPPSASNALMGISAVVSGNLFDISVGHDVVY